MMLRKSWCIFLCLLISPAQAASIRLSASVNRTEIRLGERLVLTLKMEGTQETGPPTLPQLTDFQVFPAGTSTSMQIVNGQTSISTNHRYVLTPKHAGIFTIGAAIITVGDEQYKSEPFQVKILPADAAQNEPVESSDAFITATVSKSDPYLSEGVVYTFRFYQRVNIRDANLELPEFDGFLVEDLGQQRSFETTLRGSQYMVTEIRKVIFSQQAGEISLLPARLHCKVAVKDQKQRRRRSPFDDFFDSPFDDNFGRYQLKPMVLSSKTVKLNVKELPDGPADFSGLVGKFSLSGKLSKNQLQVGESTTLTLTVRGTGNVQSIPEPDLPEFNHFKVYPDKPTGKIKALDHAISGYRTFKKALVPLKEEDIQLPGARLVYFDLDRKEYAVAQTQPFHLQVLPATGKEELKLTEILSPGTAKVAVKLLGQDLLPAHKGLTGLDKHGAGVFEVSLGLNGLFFPPAIFVGLVLFRRRRDKLERDVALRRRRTALPKARTRLKGLKSVLRKGSRREAIEAASRLVRQYLGDMLNTGGGSMTAIEATNRLKRVGVAKETIGETEALLVSLENALYGTDQGQESDLMHLDRRVRLLLGRLSTELRKTVARK